MLFYEKTAKYFKFHEDIKSIEVDDHYDRLAVIFTGKEDIIHVFDSKPYTNYLPLEEEAESLSGKVENIENDSQNESLDQNVMNLFNNISIQNDRNYNPFVSTRVESQEYIVFNNNVPGSSTEPIKYDKTSLSFIAPKKRKVKYNLYKPKLRSQLLCAIKGNSDNFIGMKWFVPANFENYISNGKEESQLLMGIHYDGNINIYTLAGADYTIQAVVDIDKLTAFPFECFPESWKCIVNFTASREIKDFYMADKPKYLYTLHIDNFIMVWIITFMSGKLTFIANYAINLSSSVINKILIDNRDNFIYTFNDINCGIYKIMDKPPFPCVFTSKFQNIISTTDNTFMEFLINEYKEDLDDEFVDKNLFEDDYSIFYQVQKPEFTLLEEYIIIPIYDIGKKTYKVFKFNNMVFYSKIFSDFTFFGNCIKGEAEGLIEELLSVPKKIAFTISPYLYYKGEKCEDICEALDKEIPIDQLLDNYYNPIIVYCNDLIIFYNPRKKQVLYKYDVMSYYTTSDDYTTFKMLKYNTILISSKKIFLNMIKFCNEMNILGVPFDKESIEELRNNHTA
jgi:hypothetical protein